MTFVAELTDLRAEVRYGNDSGQTVIHWPKVSGLNVAITYPSPAPTAYVYKPDGTLSHQVNVTHSTVASVSRLSADILPGTFALDLGENYRVDFGYTYNALTYTVSVPFDVVVAPFFAAINVSMADLSDEWADAERLLSKLATLQDATRTAEQLAQSLIQQASRDIRGWLKRRVEAEGYSWPIYIVNVDDVRPVIIARTLYKLSVSARMAIETQDTWRNEAQLRFDTMPRLQFSTTEDQSENASLTPSFRTVRTRRSW